MAIKRNEPTTNRDKLGLTRNSNTNEEILSDIAVTLKSILENNNMLNRNFNNNNTRSYTNDNDDITFTDNLRQMRDTALDSLGLGFISDRLHKNRMSNNQYNDDNTNQTNNNTDYSDNDGLSVNNADKENYVVDDTIKDAIVSIGTIINTSVSNFEASSLKHLTVIDYNVSEMLNMMKKNENAVTFNSLPVDDNNNEKSSMQELVGGFISGAMDKLGGALDVVKTSSISLIKNLPSMLTKLRAPLGAAGVGWMAYDGYKGVQNTEKWLGDKAYDDEGKVKTSAKIISGVAGALGGTDSGVSGALKGAGKGALIGNMIFPGVGAAVGAAVGGALGAVGGERIAKFMDKAKDSVMSTYAVMKDKAIDMVGDIKDKAGELWSVTKDKIASVTSSVSEQFVNISQKAIDIAKNIPNIAKGAIDTVGETITGIKDKSLSILNSVKTSAFEMVGNIVGNIKDKAGDVVDSVKDKAGDVFNFGKSVYNKFFGDDDVNVKNKAEIQQNTPKPVVRGTIENSAELSNVSKHIKEINNVPTTQLTKLDNNIMALDDATLQKLAAMMATVLSSMNNGGNNNGGSVVVIPTPSDDITLAMMGKL